MNLKASINLKKYIIHNTPQTFFKNITAKVELCFGNGVAPIFAKMRFRPKGGNAFLPTLTFFESLTINYLCFHYYSSKNLPISKYGF